MFVVVAVSAGLTEALSVLERVNSISVLVCSICRSDLSVVCLRVGSMFVLMDLQSVQVQLKCALS